MSRMATITLERDVAVPLRDGAVTRADVWRDDGARPGPAILIRTPYYKELALPTAQVDPRLAVDRGYAVVVADVRGRGTSDGVFEPYVAEGPDGADTVGWVEAQPWCNGRVVTAGMSYVGLTQWLAAAEAPPALAAFSPALTSDTPGEGWSFTNGVLEQGFLSSWAVAGLLPVDQVWLDGIETAIADHERVVATAPWSKQWFAEPADAPYWQQRSVAPDAPAHELPKLSIAGWYDVFVTATLRAHARGRHPADRLIIGPWGHDVDLSHLVGERNLGGAGNGDVYGVARRTLDFYDAVLAGRDPDLPPVAAYVLDAGRWVDLPTWPPPTADTRAVSVPGGSFTVEAGDPTPSLGGRGLLAMTPGYGFGPRDQRPLADRGDVLAVPVTDLEPGEAIAGHVTARLPVSADPGPDRQWAVTLCVQRDDGRLDNLCDGVARAPSEADEVTVPLGDICIASDRPLRLVALIAGASVPRWEPPAASGRQTVGDGAQLDLTTAQL